MKKEALARENLLPRTLTIPIDLLTQARATIMNQDTDPKQSESDEEQ